MIGYFETSALIKLVMREEETAEADALWDASDTAVTSRLSYVEARAALAAARRATRLTERGLEESRLALESLFLELELVDVTPEVARSAGDLAEEQALRGYDAIHLASVLSLGPADLALVTWDRDLARAARARSVRVAGPGG